VSATEAVAASGRLTPLSDSRCAEVADRREQILQTAQKLFAERGFRETNLNDVAIELGFRRQAVYHYFRSKDHILYELIGRAGQSFVRTLDDVVEEDLPPDVALREIVRIHVTQVLSNVDVFRILFAELAKLEGEQADRLRDDMAVYVHRIADVIAAGQRAGTFVGDLPPVPQALLIIGMCNETTKWFGGAHSQLTIRQLADCAARVVISGVTMG